jgi:cell division control protein 6
LFSPLVRSEFGDLLGILEGVGLVSLSTSLPVSSPIKGGKRTFSRSASFKAGKTQGQGQEVKLVEDVRVEEALRGLGIGVGVDVSDVKEEEVRAIWHRELTRLGKESKVKKEENDKENKEKPSDTTKVFGDANED